MTAALRLAEPPIAEPAAPPDLPPQVLALARLAELEWEVRKAEAPQTLDFIAANDTYRVVAYDHALVWRARTNRIMAVSGGLKIETTAPQIVWFTELARTSARTFAVDACTAIQSDAIASRLRRGFANYVPADAVWQPFAGPGGRLQGGALLLRRTAFNDAELRVLARLGSAFGTSHAALAARPHTRRPMLKLFGAVSLIGLLAALCFVPVPLSALAEARVAARDPEIVAAPIDAVIKEIAVEPNARVAIGDVLVRFDRTEFASAEAVARGRMAVLAADLLRLEQQAFADDRARAEVALARAKLAESQSALSLARDRLARTEIKARTAGIAQLEDRQRWLGRPVRVGERILAIANPQSTRIELAVPVEDALIVQLDADVQLFLASAPADPVHARLTQLSFEPSTEPGQPAVFAGVAEFADGAVMPRLGLTGTAKITGAAAPLGYALVRKPWSALRRLTGW